MTSTRDLASMRWRATAAVSFIALAASHFLWIREVPGFQFDEGWYARIAYRMANEPGYWPLLGDLSSYTTLYCHYVPALFFRLFGPGIVSFRAAGALEVIAGVAMLAAALAIAGERRAAAILPAVVAFFPALVINERWIVELTTFCAMTTGMLALGLVLRWKRGPSYAAYALIVLGTVLGITTHIVYIAPVLAAWLCLYSAGAITRRGDKLTVALAGALLEPFLLHIYASESEKGKGIALVLLPLAVAAVSCLDLGAHPAIARFLRRVVVAAAAVGSLLFIPLALFLEGNWQAMFANGFLEVPSLVGLSFVPVLLTGIFAFQNHRGIPRAHRRSWPVEAYCFLPLALLGVYAMVIKAGARYFEAHFLFCAAVFSVTLTRLRPRQAVLVGALWIAQGALVLGYNYFLPSLEHRQRSVIFHFWRWRDGSEGFLPKLPLARHLADEGCTLKDVDSIEDSSTALALELLSHGEWPPLGASACRLGHHLRIQNQPDPNSAAASGARIVRWEPYWVVGSDR